jgi:hypothetical protein
MPASPAEASQAEVAQQEGEDQLVRSKIDLFHQWEPAAGSPPGPFVVTWIFIVRADGWSRCMRWSGSN